MSELRLGPEVEALWALWGAVPLTRLDYALARPLTPEDVRHLVRRLQGRFWQSLCLAPAPCADAPGTRCQEPDTCPAFRAFPLSGNKNIESFRMARVMVRPAAEGSSLSALLLGPPEEGLVQSVHASLAQDLGDMMLNMVGESLTLAEAYPPRQGHFRLEMCTPWNRGRQIAAAAEHRGEELIAALARRGYKFTAMACSMGLQPGAAPDDGQQSMRASQAAKRLALAVLPGNLMVLSEDEMSTRKEPRISVSQRHQASNLRFHQLAQRGGMTLQATAAAWPWLAMAQVAGIGEGCDEGWGALALQRLRS